jgi:hypothetical protein
MKNNTPKYEGSTFQEVRDQVFSDPYPGYPEKLPIDPIASRRFFKRFQNLLLAAARRTVAQKADLLPYFDKLIHGNGMAFSGIWEITEDTPYSGYFAKGSKGLLIGRASVILTETTSDAKRGFGFAGKIFPTLDPNEKVKTADFLLLDNFVGSPAKHYSDIGISNHPVIGMGMNILRYFGVLATTLASFPRVDLPLTYRPVFKVASLGLPEGQEPVSPTWMMVQARAETRIQDKKDFREELMVENQTGGKLLLDVYTSETPRQKDGDRPWTRVGLITLNESILSESCDHRLHFHHPKVKGTKWTPENRMQETAAS